MITVEQIANELSPDIAANNSAIGETNRRRVKLGYNGVVRPNVVLSPRDVNYVSATDLNDHGVATLAPDCPITLDSVDGMYDTECWLAQPAGSSEFMIVNIADSKLHGTDGITPAEMETRDAAFSTQDRLRIMRLIPGADGLSVTIDCGENSYSDGNGNFFTTATINLSDPTDEEIFVPASTALSTDEHRIVAIAWDPANAKYIAVAGTADVASDSDTPPKRSDFEEPDAYAAIDLSGYIPAGYVYMYDGQAAPFVEDDMLRIFDPRLLTTPVQPTATVTTSNNTATLIAAIPVAELSAVIVTGEVVGALDDYTAALGATFTAAARRASGGNVTLVASVTPTVVEDSGSSPTVTVTANTGTQTIDIKVTGVTAEDWTWRVTYRTTTT